jgi:hypothetical protein
MRHYVPYLQVSPVSFTVRPHDRLTQAFGVVFSVAGVLALLRQNCSGGVCGVSCHWLVRFGLVAEGVRSNIALHRTPPPPCPVLGRLAVLAVSPVS